MCTIQIRPSPAVLQKNCNTKVEVPVPNGTLLPRQIRRKLAVIIMILKSDDPDPRSFCLLDPEFQQGGFVKLVKLLY